MSLQSNLFIRPFFLIIKMNPVIDLKGPFTLLAAMLLFSTNGMWMAISPEGATPFVVGASRVVIGTATIALWCVVSKQKIVFQGWPWLWVISYAFCLWSYQLVFFSAVNSIGVAVGTVIAQGSVPIFGGILQWICYRKAPGKTWYPSAIIGIVGLCLVNQISGVSASFTGFICALLAGFLTVAGFISAKHVSTYRSPTEGILIVMLFTSLMMLPMFFLFPIDWLLTPKGMFCMGMLGFFNCGIAFILQFIGLKTTAPTMASIIALAEPLGAATIGIVFLEEPTTTWTLVGIACLLASVLWMVIFPEKDVTDNK